MDQYELKFILENWKDQEWHEDDVDLFKKDEKDEKEKKMKKMKKVAKVMEIKTLFEKPN